jgi:hypothetical protein
MKYVILTVAALLSACTYPELPNENVWSSRLDTALPPETEYVKVLGRTWTVYPVEDHAGVFAAQRDNLDLNPYGAPVARRTPQAVRAIELATGCRVVRSSLVQDTSARFFASVICK